MKRRGFTLVEIMIVVAIIALLAAIAIPNVLRARLTANEAAAQAALKTLATAEISYRIGNTSYGTLSQLASATPPYIDSQLGSGTKNGYLFYAPSPAAESFVVLAIRQSTTTGNRAFCITEDGVVRAAPPGTVPAFITHDACTGSFFPPHPPPRQPSQP